MRRLLAYIAPHKQRIADRVVLLGLHRGDGAQPAIIGLAIDSRRHERATLALFGLFFVTYTWPGWRSTSRSTR